MPFLFWSPSFPPRGKEEIGKWKAERGERKYEKWEAMIGNEASCLMDGFIGGRDAAFPIFGYTRKSRLRQTTRTITKPSLWHFRRKRLVVSDCMQAFQACDI